MKTFISLFIFIFAFAADSDSDSDSTSAFTITVTITVTITITVAVTVTITVIEPQVEIILSEIEQGQEFDNQKIKEQNEELTSHFIFLKTQVGESFDELKQLISRNISDVILTSATVATKNVDRAISRSLFNELIAMFFGNLYFGRNNDQAPLFLDETPHKAF